MDKESDEVNEGTVYYFLFPNTVMHTLALPSYFI